MSKKWLLAVDFWLQLEHYFRTGCPAHVLVVPGERTTRILNTGYHVNKCWRMLENVQKNSTQTWICTSKFKAKPHVLLKSRDPMDISPVYKVFLGYPWHRPYFLIFFYSGCIWDGSGVFRYKLVTASLSCSITIVKYQMWE